VVLGKEQFGGELGRIIDGPRALQCEVLSDTSRRDAGQLLLMGDLETRGRLVGANVVEGLDWIDTARRQEHDGRSCVPGQLEAVNVPVRFVSIT
jgi:hypothetical protein